MNNWPATLQDKINQSGFRQQFGSTKLRSDNSVGPAKVRRRFTKRIDNYTTTVNLERGEYDTFNNFYDVTLNGGVNTFLFTDPITNLETTYRFVNDPSITIIGGNEFLIQMTWERLP